MRTHLTRAVVIILVLALSALIGARIHADGPQFDTRILGDVNGDGLVTREDGVILYLATRGYAFPRHPYDWQALVCGRLDCGDVDGDGYILPADYVAILDYVASDVSVSGIGGACMAHDVTPAASCTL